MLLVFCLSFLDQSFRARGCVTESLASVPDLVWVSLAE